MKRNMTISVFLAVTTNIYKVANCFVGCEEENSWKIEIQFASAMVE
jgi:hypothetical protein